MQQIEVFIKKNPLKKFYNEVNDDQIKNLIKKSEKIRYNWQNNKFQNNNSISKWVVDQSEKIT